VLDLSLIAGFRVPPIANDPIPQSPGCIVEFREAVVRRKKRTARSCRAARNNKDQARRERRNADCS
jgi:hypothetical protein